jgi:hypothetical protein
MVQVLVDVKRDSGFYGFKGPKSSEAHFVRFIAVERKLELKYPFIFHALQLQLVYHLGDYQHVTATAR